MIDSFFIDLMMTSFDQPTRDEAWSAACDGELDAAQWAQLLELAPAHSERFAAGRAVWAAHHATRDALTCLDAPALSATYGARMWAALEREPALSPLGAPLLADIAPKAKPSAALGASTGSWWQRFKAAPAMAGAAFAGVAAVGFVGFSVMSVVGPESSIAPVVATAPKPAPILAVVAVTPITTNDAAPATAEAGSPPIPVEYLMAHRQLSAGVGSAGAAQSAGLGYMRAAYSAGR